MAVVVAEGPSVPPAPFKRWESGTLEVTFLDDDGGGGQEVLAWCETVGSLCYIAKNEPDAVQGIPLHNLKGWAFVPGETAGKPESSVPPPRRRTGARGKLNDAHKGQET